MESIQDQSNAHTNILSAILFTIGWMLNIASDLTVDDLFTWVFRSLSILSLVLIIVINLPKAINVIKGKKKDDSV